MSNDYDNSWQREASIALGSYWLFWKGLLELTWSSFHLLYTHVYCNIVSIMITTKKMKMTCDLFHGISQQYHDLQKCWNKILDKNVAYCYGSMMYCSQSFHMYWFKDDCCHISRNLINSMWNYLVLIRNLFSPWWIIWYDN